MGAAPGEARSAVELAAVLAARGARGGGERAVALVVHDLGLAREVGATAICRRAETAQASLPSRRSSARPRSGVFRRKNGSWRLRLGAEPATLPDSLGPRYLAALLACPGRELHVTDLAGMRTDVGDAGPMLDATAKAAYRRRVEALRAEWPWPRNGRNDVGRGGRARTELDAVARELGAAVGLGGRDRRAERSWTPCSWRRRVPAPRCGRGSGCTSWSATATGFSACAAATATGWR